MKIYISGKITDKDPIKQAVNIVKFQEAEDLLISKGYLDICNPCKLDHSKCEGKWYKYMKVALIGMLHCDGIYMIDGHKNSTGASIELTLSMILNYVRIRL